MLVVSVITGVIGYVIYTVIKLKIEEWLEEIRMSRLSLKKRHSSENEFQMDNSTVLDGKNVIEISSDESVESDVVLAEVNAADMLQFQKSTDSVQTDEEEETSLFGYQPGSKDKHALFKWDQKNAGQNQRSKAAHSDSDSDNSYQESKWFHRNQKKKLKSTGELASTNKKKEDEVVPEVIPQYEQMISGIKVKLPVKPYSCQIAVMNKVIQGCTKEENCLLESPTGSGKTLALLCSVLAWHEHHAQEVRKRKQAHGADDFEHFSDEESSSGCCDSAKECNNGYNNVEDRKKMKLSRIYYGTRTHTQIEQVVRELKKTAYKHKTMTILSSRERTCIQNSKRNKTELCNELLDPKNQIGCRYYNQLNASNIHKAKQIGMQPVWDIEELVATGKERDLCPYFAARTFMEVVDIIFCPYNYLIDPDIRESMQLDLTDHVIILDEAHNIEDICRDVASVDFREDDLEAAAMDCKYIASQRVTSAPKYKTLQDYILRLNEYLKSITLEKTDYHSENLSSPYWTGAELLELFNMHELGETAYPVFLDACSTALEDFAKSKEEVRSQLSNFVMPAISPATKILIEHLMYSMRMIASPQYVNDYRACVIETVVRDFKYAADDTWYASNKREQRARTLKLLCMNPGVIFAPLAKNARCIILASGTLTPTTTFQSELSTKFDHVLNTGHVIPKDQVYATCVPKGPNNVSLKATYQNVNSWAFQDELGQVLLDVCESVPHGILCFFSSYKMMNTQLERWQKTSIWNKINNIKQVFVEPRHVGDLNNIMNDFRDIIRTTSDGPSGGIDGALFLAVFRGKVAEGIDFRDDEARCVVTVGIPYPVRKDPVIDMKFKYNDMNIARDLLKGSDWYSVQAFRALNQALGRCLRHVKDWGAVLLVDERFSISVNKESLPKWVKTMWISHTKYNLRPQLRDFVARQKAREANKGHSKE